MTYKILPNFLLSRLSPYMDEIIDDHQCGFRSNRSTTDQILFIREILKKKWEYYETLSKYFKEAYDSLRRQVLYNILIKNKVPLGLLG
jgi:hypothetical protein